MNDSAFQQFRGDPGDLLLLVLANQYDGVAQLCLPRIHIVSPCFYYVLIRIEAKMRCLIAFGERIAAREPNRRNPDAHRPDEQLLGPWHGRDCSCGLKPEGKGALTPQLRNNALFDWKMGTNLG